jgi:hypothetical protein
VLLPEQRKWARVQRRVVLSWLGFKNKPKQMFDSYYETYINIVKKIHKKNYAFCFLTPAVAWCMASCGVRQHNLRKPKPVKPTTSFSMTAAALSPADKTYKDGIQRLLQDPGSR